MDRAVGFGTFVMMSWAGAIGDEEVVAIFHSCLVTKALLLSIIC